MINVDIIRSQPGDIIIIETGQYLTTTCFYSIVEQLRSRVSDELQQLWFWDCKEENIESCLGYKGIAIKLTGHVKDRKATKAEVHRAIEEILR